MAEQVAAKGYAALKKQVDINTVITPDVYVPYYKESWLTDAQRQDDTPIYGQMWGRFQTVDGQRKHMGEITVLHEPNTGPRFADSCLTKTATSGSNPYTNTFKDSVTTNPNFYTLDISTGEHVFRFFGLGNSELSPDLDGNKWLLKAKGSAIGSFDAREVGSIAGLIITLANAPYYDGAPGKGLVIGDLVRIRKTTGVTVDTTVTAVTATTVTVGSVGTGAAGDMIYLRPATQTFALLEPFLFARTQFLFSPTSAAAALAGTQTRIEKGSTWSVKNPFNSEDGEARSGGFDPDSLVRVGGTDVTYKVKRFFDDKADLRLWASRAKYASVIRMYAGSTNQYECRLTLNNLTFKNHPKPTMETKTTCYSDLEFLPNYDQTDGQAFDLTYINAIASI